MEIYLIREISSRAYVTPSPRAYKIRPKTSRQKEGMDKGKVLLLQVYYPSAVQAKLNKSALP